MTLVALGAVIVGGFAYTVARAWVPEPSPPLRVSDPRVEVLENDLNVVEKRLKVLKKALEREKAARTRGNPTSGALINPAPDRPTTTLESTAYCLTGTMANGETVYDGAAASNLYPLGTRVYVHDLGRTFTVADRVGHSSDFDIAMPGDCDRALEWGRRTIEVSVVG